MPNVRITDLDLMPFSSITSEDVFPIVDITDDVTYKIELSQLTKYISNFSNRWYIESGETITVTTNTQSFIYGDLLIYGELFLEENSKLFVVNGNIELISGGTITGDGTTHLIELPEFDTYVTGGTYSAGTATFVNNKGETFNVVGFYSGTTDGITTGATFNEYSGTAKFKDNVGGEFDLTGLTISNFIYIPSGETITVEKNTQKFVYGNIIIDGNLVLEDGSQLLNLNGDIIVSGGTISGTGDIISVDLPEIDTKITGFTYNNNEFTILNNFGTSYSVTLDEMSGLTINGLLSADTINASTIDLCATNGTLFTDTISGCSPINVLSFTNFHEGLSGVTISGGNFYGDGSNLTNINNYTSVTIDISSTQILGMGSNPVELLPPPGIDKYYCINSVAVEFTDNGTPYTIAGAGNPYIFISLNATANMFLQKAFITTAGNKAFHFTHFEGGIDFANSLNFQYSGTAVNKSVQFKVWGNVDPTLGDGTLKVKISYKIETFGS